MENSLLCSFILVYFLHCLLSTTQYGLLDVMLMMVMGTTHQHRVIWRLTDDERRDDDYDGLRHAAAASVPRGGGGRSTGTRTRTTAGLVRRRRRPVSDQHRHAGDAPVQQRVGDRDGDHRQQKADGELKRRPAGHVDDRQLEIVRRPVQMTRRPAAGTVDRTFVKLWLWGSGTVVKVRGSGGSAPVQI